MTTIRKAIVSAYGPPSVLEVVEATIPSPPRGAVQVRIAYAGFSGTDVNMRLGKYPLQRSAPLTPGYCFVGHVVACGPGCGRDWIPGAVVAAISVYDADAQLINIAEKYLLLVPTALAGSDDGLQQVVALSLDWATAYGMVARAANVKPGQRVFVHGLSGAVGHAITVLCQQRGATVYGTASAPSHAALRAKGIVPLVYTDKGWMQVMRSAGGAHAVFDALGFESWDESYAVLCDDAGGASGSSGGGVLVAYGGNKASLEGRADRIIYPWIAKLLARNLNLMTKRRTSFYYIDRNSKYYQQDFEALMDLAAEGTIRASVKKIFELETESLREAHASWGKLPGIGSLLVRVSY